MQPVTITELVAARVALKRDEDKAVAARREIDEQIAAALRDPAKPEGTVSSPAGEFKISVTYKVARKTDSDALQKVWDKLSAGQQAAFKWSAELSLTAFRKLDDKDQIKLSALIEAKPASPTIKIEAA